MSTIRSLHVIQFEEVNVNDFGIPRKNDVTQDLNFDWKKRWSITEWQSIMVSYEQERDTSTDHGDRGEPQHLDVRFGIDGGRNDVIVSSRRNSARIIANLQVACVKFAWKKYSSLLKSRLLLISRIYLSAKWIKGSKLGHWNWCDLQRQKSLAWNSEKNWNNREIHISWSYTSEKKLLYTTVIIKDHILLINYSQKNVGGVTLTATMERLPRPAFEDAKILLSS